MSNEIENWVEVGPISEIPPLGSRVITTPEGDIAVFRNRQDEVFALEDRCPHKAGPLSQGIVSGRTVACPLHGWLIQLSDGKACAPDEGCTHAFATRIKNGQVFVNICWS